MGEVSEADLLFYSQIAMARKEEKDKEKNLKKTEIGHLDSKRDFKKHILMQAKTSSSSGHFTSELRAETEGKGHGGHFDVPDSAMFEQVSSKYRPSQAFSDVSIRSGMQHGLFGYEDYTYLQRVNCSNERKEAYNR